jgi:PIN domain nuclease of toxin-antitoxin system
MLNLDTHVLLHALGGDLTAAEAALLSRDSWSICPIVLWEIGKLAELRRIELDLGDRALRRLLTRVQLWPITLDVCLAIAELDFRGDPADELIAATSVAHDLPLVTRDARIRRSRRVPIAR